MAAILAALAVVLFLAFMWLGAIIVDRYVARWQSAALEEHYATYHTELLGCSRTPYEED
jgi:hypothetical protein